MEHPRRTSGVRQILAEPGTKFGIVVAIGALVLAGTQLAGAADRPSTRSAPAAVPTAATGDGEVFVAVSPTRVLDTRNASGGPIGVDVAGKLGAGQQIDLPLTSAAPRRSSAPVPAGAVSAVLNITIDEDADAKSFITVWPTGEPRPLTSANNAEPGLVTPNLTFAKLGVDGKVSFYNFAGATNLAVDLVGYTMPLTGAADAVGINRSTPQSFGEGSATPVPLGATEAPVATFTAPEDGTYVLDGTTSIAKTSTLSAGVNPDLACTWRVGPDAAGPTFSQTLVASVLIGGGPASAAAGSSTEVNALGQATLAAGQSATLDCSATAALLTTGDVQSTAVAYNATKVG
jgi:hypothetical protein